MVDIHTGTTDSGAGHGYRKPGPRDGDSRDGRLGNSPVEARPKRIGLRPSVDTMGSSPDRDARGGSQSMNPRSAAETSILARVADGDPGAVKEVLSRYSALVWSLASGLSKDPHEVEDVVQDIFVDVWRSAKRYDPAVASEATFIATIARRRVIDRRRRAGRRVDPEPLEEELAPGEMDTGLRQVELDDEAAQAREAVAQLSGDRRRVLELSVVNGLTHREIAADTGIPLGTVKSHIRRGLAEVSERLKARRASLEEGTR